MLNKLEAEDMPSFWKLLKQFVKFGVVGVSNTLLQLSLYYGFVFLGLHYIVANVVAYAISVLNAYYWNNKYVFKGKGNSLRKLAKVYASYGFTLLLSTALLFVVVDIIGISYLVAPLIKLIITVPINFLLSKFWAFRKRDENGETH